MSSEVERIELEPVPPPSETPAEYPALPLPDRSREAWLFLLGSTIVEANVWGIPISIGILHAYWTNDMFKGDDTIITLAATLQTGLLYTLAGVFGPIYTAFPRWQKPLQFWGLAMAVASFVGSGFASKPWHLLITLGIFYPFSALMYIPCALLIFEWFTARRGVAFGIMLAGTGLGGTIYPFVVAGLLHRFGYRTTMISLGIAYGIICGLALIPIKRRVPLARREQARKKSWKFLKARLLYVGVALIGMISLGNFIPSLWLPLFVDDLELHKPDSTVLVAIMNGSRVPGSLLIGVLIDRLPLRIVLAISAIASSLACFFLWGFGTSGGPLVIFVLIFGMLGLTFTTFWTRMISMISNDDPFAQTYIFSIFTIVRGVMNFASGPISDSLLRLDVLRGSVGGYGFKNYGVLLIYTASTIFVGGLTALMYR